MGACGEDPPGLLTAQSQETKPIQNCARDSAST